MSQKYKEYKRMDLPSVGNEIIDFWKEEQIFEKSVSLRNG